MGLSHPLRPHDKPSQKTISTYSKLLIDQRRVHAATRTEDGETLLMFAARQARPRAFNALAPLLEMNRVNEVDLRGNAVLHHLARHLTNRAMRDIAWEDGLNDFLNIHAEGIDWEQENHRGQTAEALAIDLNRERFLSVLEAFIPGDSDNDSYISEATDNSAGDRMKEAIERFLGRKQKRGG